MSDIQFNMFDAFVGGYRNTDPETSVEAALRDLGGKANDRVLALHVHYVNPQGLTDFELADWMGRQQTSAGKRRGELRDFGLIERTEVRRLAPSGSPAIVWVINERGRRVHDEVTAG